MVTTDIRLVSKRALRGHCTASATSILVKPKRGEARNSGVSLPGATRNLQDPQTSLTWRKVVSQALMSLCFTSIWPGLLAPHWLILFPPLRSHLRSPMAASFSLRNLARQSVTKMSAE